MLFFNSVMPLNPILHIHNNYGADNAERNHYEIKVSGNIVLSFLMYSVKQYDCGNCQNENTEENRSVFTEKHCNEKSEKRYHRNNCDNEPRNSDLFGEEARFGFLLLIVCQY